MDFVILTRIFFQKILALLKTLPPARSFDRYGKILSPIQEKHSHSSL